MYKIKTMVNIIIKYLYNAIGTKVNNNYIILYDVHFLTNPNCAVYEIIILIYLTAMSLYIIHILQLPIGPF